jgi:hypothetical protein
MTGKEVKIQIGNFYWIFQDPVKVKMLHADSSGGHCEPERFCLNIETIGNPLVFRKIQDGNITKYVKLA